MNITFMQRWRGNIWFVAIILFLMWLLMRDDADYMKNHFHWWFAIGGLWLFWSACWCAMSQFMFRRSIKRIQELGRQMQAGRFDGNGNWY
jgi:hypothetical protein